MSQLKTLSQRGKAHKQQRALTNAEYFDGLFHRSNSSRTSNVVVNHSHGELDIVHQDFSVAAKNGFDTQFADRINSRPKPQYDITGWVYTPAHHDATQTVSITSLPPKTTPSTHLQVLRNPRHDHQHLHSLLSPALCNTSETYIRHLEKQYDLSRRLARDQRTCSRLIDHQSDAHVALILQWGRHLSEFAYASVLRSAKYVYANKQQQGIEQQVAAYRREHSGRNPPRRVMRPMDAAEESSDRRLRGIHAAYARWAADAPGFRAAGAERKMVMEREREDSVEAAEVCRVYRREVYAKAREEEEMEKTLRDGVVVEAVKPQRSIMDRLSADATFIARIKEGQRLREEEALKRRDERTREEDASVPVTKENGVDQELCDAFNTPSAPESEDVSTIGETNDVAVVVRTPAVEKAVLDSDSDLNEGNGEEVGTFTEERNVTHTKLSEDEGSDIVTDIFQEVQNTSLVQKDFISQPPETPVQLKETIDISDSTDITDSEFASSSKSFTQSLVTSFPA